MAIELSDIQAIKKDITQDQFTACLSDVTPLEAILSSKGLDANVIEIIKKNLILHFYIVYFETQSITTKSESDGEFKIENKVTGAGFDATIFGQMAIQTDTTNTLRSMTNPSKDEAKTQKIVFIDVC